MGGVAEGRPPTVDEHIVLEEVAQDPSTSVRVIQRRTGISKSTAHAILKRYQLHPYHVQRVQTLLPRDHLPRLQFCREMLRRLRRDPGFFNRILWSDESTCKRDGYLNMHNLHSWNFENPRLFREDNAQYQFKINYWTGIVNGQIIGPIELPPIMNADNYLDLLRNTLPNHLEDINLDVLRQLWFQNDGCPAHYALRVRNYLDEEFPGRWIGRGGPVLWPPRSPDLNPLDFFYWGYLKEIVYKVPITTIAQLRARVRDAAEFISNSGHARRIRRSFIRRCLLCIRAGGGHFQHLL